MAQAGIPVVKKVSWYQDPHFQGLVMQALAVLLWVTNPSNLTFFPASFQPYIICTATILGAIGTAFHIKGLANPTLTRTIPMILFLLMFLIGTAHAGFLMSVPKVDKTSYILSLPAGTAVYLMPIEGFDVGGSLPKPTYGISLNEDIVFGQNSSLSGETNFSPYFGVGASLYLDGAGVINQNGPLVLMAGLNLLGPDLDLLGMGNGQGLVPNVLCTFDFATGEKKVTGGLTVFTDLGPGTAQKL